MRKIGVCCTTIFLCCILAGIYGILHDQLTYTLSPEYYTRFKFDQFNVNPAEFGGPRMAVAAIGFLASWWTGFFIGAGLGITALLFNNHREMVKVLPRAIVVVFITAILMGPTGYLYGRFVLLKYGVDWYIPKELAKPDRFIQAASIHNYSYVGALLGLLLGISYLFVQKAKANLMQSGLNLQHEA